MHLKLFVLFISSLLLGATLAVASIPENRQDYIEYLKLRRKAHMINIRNKDKKKFIPWDVVWLDKEGAKMVPRPNPFRKVFMPRDPDANNHGIVNLPNVIKDEEEKKLSFVLKELERLGIYYRP